MDGITLEDGDEQLLRNFQQVQQTTEKMALEGGITLDRRWGWGSKAWRIVANSPAKAMTVRIKMEALRLRASVESSARKIIGVILKLNLR
ncbi:MAG: hypothetical protein B0A82_20770 [Alkalinema sp. CACIAM 70d]|nr:MAG: hypothetical protein B0A82_20770 [Alkalinema sp. CACIAM 70d]